MMTLIDLIINALNIQHIQTVNYNVRKVCMKRENL